MIKDNLNTSIIKKKLQPCINILKFLKNRDKWSISGTRDKASKIATVPAKTAQMKGLAIFLMTYVNVYRSIKTKSQRKNQITPERATETY